MGKIILYHGSPDKEIKPAFGLGENRHDYGKGFYLTENIDLAKEWAVCRPDETNGWVHKYELDMEGLKVLDFQKYSILSWLAELMKHRDAADSYIAKAFVRDEIDVEILEELLLLGGLGIQYCIKSELAYSRLSERKEELISVEYDEFNEKYNERDVTARKRMKELIDSDANKVTNVFSTLL